MSDPSNRLLEVSSQYWESRGLFIAAERRIANLIAAGDNGSGKGVGTETLAKQTGVETGKLGPWTSRCHRLRNHSQGD